VGLGGFMTFAYFSSNTSQGNIVLFIIFLALIVVGAFSTFLLASPESLNKSSPTTSLTSPLRREDVDAYSDDSGSKEIDAAIPFLDESIHTSLLLETIATLKLFFEPKMARFALIFW
jgi:hypothetical protein